jgi:hypothetical protein
MTKQPRGEGTKRSQAPKAKQAPKARVKYQCMCFPLIAGGYEKFTWNSASGTYDGPFPCTEAECIKCNKSPPV